MQANFIHKIAKSDPKEFQLELSALVVYRRFFPYIWRSRGLLVIGSLSIFLLSFLQVLIPQITRYVIDILIPTKQYAQVSWLGLVIFVITITIGGLNFLRSYTLGIAGQRTLYALRQDLYSHLQSLSLRFFDSQRTGTLMTRFGQDIESVDKLITNDIAEILAETVTFLVVVGYLFYADWRLISLILVTLPIMILLSQFWAQRMRLVYREVQRQNVAMNNHLQETLSNIKLIQATANQSYEIDRFNNHNQGNQIANSQAITLSSSFAPVIDVMNSLGFIIVIAYGSWEVIQNRLSVGELTAFLAYLNVINQPIKRYSRIMQIIQKGATALERIFELLDQEATVKEKTSPLVLSPLKGRVVFAGVHFAYEMDKPILSEISFTIQPGMTLALVGSSGAGKTTIANLLARFYDPQAGLITIDGYDLRDLELKSYRQQIGIVSQETLLLHSTVAENIAYGKPGIDRESIEQAAHLAYAHDFIMALPQGYDTTIGERGIKLSGGQRQRLAIARALIRDPRLLILDEATSSLDSEAENLIQQSLRTLCQDRSSLVIAHRLSTIQSADRVLVLEQGKIVEMGTHSTLLALQGRYARLYNLQFPQKPLITI